MLHHLNLDCWTMSVPRPGPPSVLQRQEARVETPGADDIVISQRTIGVNYHDVYVRSGQYETMPFPGVPGIEAAGVIEWVGDGVKDLAVGDRVAYITSRYGGYASRRTLSANLAVPVPEDISFEVAAAALLKGVTADMLLSRLHDVGPNSTVVVHAAAGGVGQILIQMAKSRGAKVVGAVGSTAKMELVRALGCDHVALYGADQLRMLVADVSEGQGADIVFDGVGAATFEQSLECLKAFGQLALFGQASGPVVAIEPSRLATRSLVLWRPVVFHHTADLPRYRASAKRVFEAINSGSLAIKAPMLLPLEQAAIAHERLENGVTTGSTVLTV
ncbi:MAG: alcohol dehydrogenase [Sphingomonadales bacterium]|nr:alcohol dehydrogenase [Sphingomonadales bacterium]